jgi:hypothetical protein
MWKPGNLETFAILAVDLSAFRSGIPPNPENKLEKVLRLADI